MSLRGKEGELQAPETNLTRVEVGDDGSFLVERQLAPDKIRQSVAVLLIGEQKASYGLRIHTLQLSTLTGTGSEVTYIAPTISTHQGDVSMRSQQQRGANPPTLEVAVRDLREGMRTIKQALKKKSVPTQVSGIEFAAQQRGLLNRLQTTLGYQLRSS